MMTRPYPPSHLTLQKYRSWFYAAALYNFLWGILVILWPEALLELLGISHPTNLVLWQVVGMFVLVYAPAYAWAAHRPKAHYHLICIGLLGKLFGPLGFLWALVTGQLPFTFGWIILFNDIVWWPAFACYLNDISRVHGVWPLLKGE